MTATEAPANFVQKRCTTFKALMISSAKCDGQWGKREVQGCSGLMMLHWTAEQDLKWRSTAEFPWVHIDESFDKRTQHERISNSNEFRVKSSSFITAVVADQRHMDRIDGGAVSANLLGECMHPDREGSQNKRDVGDGPQDVKPKVVFLARNLSVITVSNAKLCSERSIRGEEGHDYHGRLNAKTAVELLAAEDIDVQPQDRCVVGEDIAPAIFSFNVTTFGTSVEANHLRVCTELQRPWKEDMEYKKYQEQSKKKKKKKQKTACPGSVHGLAQPCTECNSVYCYST